MTKALVLMKAMPPTHGHKNLIQFASLFADEGTVLIDTAHNEPMVTERVRALSQMVPKGWNVDHFWFDINDPSDPDYWPVWDGNLKKYQGYDYVVASEDYAFKVAEKIGARYIPYDPTREMRDVRATQIRNDPYANFKLIAPQFQPYLRTVVTIFGAESNGKTTLSKRLHEITSSHWIFEWARPYLETVGPEIHVQSMTDIWHGQLALQNQARTWRNKPLLLQDTDLYSTIGYWEQPHWTKALGRVPTDLRMDASQHQADLYIIPRANIEFEADPIRYGGDKRESPDDYWIAFAEANYLNYVVLDDADINKRIDDSMDHVFRVMNEKLDKIKYERPFN